MGHFNLSCIIIRKAVVQTDILGAHRVFKNIICTSIRVFRHSYFEFWEELIWHLFKQVSLYLIMLNLYQIFPLPHKIQIIRIWDKQTISLQDFLKATFHKFHLVHSWILCPIYKYESGPNSQKLSLPEAFKNDYGYVPKKLCKF